MEVKGLRYVTPRFENPDKETLIPLFEYFPVLFGPEKIKAHRKYTEYIVYDKNRQNLLRIRADRLHTVGRI
jgi:hypothetical protein